MTSKSVIIPCATLASIVGLMLIFIWWWFPRAWKKGSKKENDEIAMSLAGVNDGLTREERMQMAGQHAKEYVQAMEARNKARAEGREPEGPPPVYNPLGRAYKAPSTAVV
ncbi:hypothetical protein BGZ63DRAFT_390333 [Mariannaea sp. PMI_226]|nr:hypothetical protein BGZ63DRAFT_390333 [Mariannaea sp. PMI_226]